MATVKVDLGLALTVVDGVTVALDMAEEDNPVRICLTQAGAFEGDPANSQALWLEPLEARVLAAQLLAAASMADARGGGSPEDE